MLRAQLIRGQIGPVAGLYGEVLVAVRPSAIVVSSQPPDATSARNIWPAEITGLTMLADRVRLDLHGQPPALADATAAAVTELALRPGSRVWLSAKATDVEVYHRATAAPGDGPDTGVI